MNSFYLENVRLRGEAATVTVEDGVIAALGAGNDKGLPRVDGEGKRLLPGFLDLHTHGAAGVDVNAAYLEAAAARHPNLAGVLECLRVDLREEPCRLPAAELVIANLLVEYIGCSCFQRLIGQVGPEYASCVLQINAEDGWVSDSPYLHAFDVLEAVHHDLDGKVLEKTMLAIGYRVIQRTERGLPNGKKFLRMDFQRP